MKANICIREYNKKYENMLIDFLVQCLPESGRNLDLSGRHKFYQDIENHFVAFWCMFDNDKIVGTVAVKELVKKKCELKSLYLLERHHGKGLGQCLLKKAVEFAKESGYEQMYLDSLSTSKKALALYHKAGFVQTEQYNQNEFADVFMVLKLQ